MRADVLDLISLLCPFFPQVCHVPALPVFDVVNTLRIYGEKAGLDLKTPVRCLGYASSA